MGTAQGVDFYRFSDNLSDEERGVRQTVRSFVAQHFLPHIKDYFRDGVFPLELAPELGALGCSDRRSRGPAVPA